MASTSPTQTANLPINSLINNGATTTGTTSSANPGGDLGQNQFLKLLTTELANQDPLNPIDDTQSIAQLANFSTLQSQQQLTTAFQTFQSNFAVLQSASLIGQSAEVNNPSSDVTGAANTNSSTISGKIASVQVQNGQPYFTMLDSSGNKVVNSNGVPELFSTTQILALGS